MIFGCTLPLKITVKPAAIYCLINFEETFPLLTDNTKIGKQKDEIRKRLRQFVLGNYLIFYRIEDDLTIVIIRVMHGARDIQEQF